MTHRFPIKEIARQAGLGTATVDRALNGRAHVSPQTRNRVRAAIRELEQQEQQLAARGRRLFVDVVVEAPQRFTREIAAAAETVITGLLGTAVFRPRFAFHQIMTEADVVAILARIQRRGSQGVVLKARDTPDVCAAVDALVGAGIPVFTLVTDLPGSRRTGYAGLDNRNAGRTAAYLLASALPARAAGTVVTTRSQDTFFGEAERASHFRTLFGTLRPGIGIVDVSGGAGLRRGTTEALERALDRTPRIDAVYSMGGGNAAIRAALAARGHRPAVFIAHDLDRENRALLGEGRLSFVLHHDLRADMRALFLAIAAFHRLVPDPGPRLVSDVQIVSPHNIPAA